MFIRVVLPAPFSPRSAWISRSPSSRSIASFASVPPGKRLVMPRISRTDVLSLITKAGRPEGRPASNSPTGSGSRDRLELAGLHVVGGLRELVRQSGRDRIEIPDRGRADAVVGRVVREVPGLLALVFEALDPVARRVLKVLLRAGDDAGGGVGERQVLVDIDADAVDLGVARRAQHARAGEAGDLEENVDALADHGLRRSLALVRRVEVLDVVDADRDGRLDRLRAVLVTLDVVHDRWDVRASADCPDLAALGDRAGDDAREVTRLSLIEQEPLIVGGDR